MTDVDVDLLDREETDPEWVAVTVADVFLSVMSYDFVVVLLPTCDELGVTIFVDVLCITGLDSNNEFTLPRVSTDVDTIDLVIADPVTCVFVVEGAEWMILLSLVRLTVTIFPSVTVLTIAGLDGLGGDNSSVSIVIVPEDSTWLPLFDTICIVDVLLESASVWILFTFGGPNNLAWVTAEALGNFIKLAVVRGKSWNCNFCIAWSFSFSVCVVVE